MTWGHVSPGLLSGCYLGSKYVAMSGVSGLLRRPECPDFIRLNDKSSEQVSNGRIPLVYIAAVGYTMIDHDIPH